MEWLVLVGIGIAVIGTFIYFKSKRSVPLPSRERQVNPRVSRPSANKPIQIPAEPIIWEDIPISSSSNGNQWLEIDNSSETNSISWVELEIEQPSVVEDDNFLNPNVPDDLDNILRGVIDTRDLYSQEIFMAGEQVYVCRLHRLAYHEDSWIELGHKCPVCGNDAHTGRYQLPG